MDKEVEVFVDEEIRNSKIWIVSGIIIPILLYGIISPYLNGKLNNIMSLLSNKKALDIQSIFFILLFFVEIFLSLFLPKIVKNKSKKSIKAGFLVISLILGIILSLFSEVLKKTYYLFNVKRNLILFITIIAIILVVFAIKIGFKSSRKEIENKINENDADMLEKIKFYTTVKVYSNIVKVVLVLLIVLLVI